MSDIVNVRRSLSAINKQDAFDGYSKVVISVSDELQYSAGTDTGRTLTLECPFGSQKMANNILAKIKGFQYQPYTASKAYLNPAAELGDAFSSGKVYSGIYKKDVSFGPLYTANLAAPGGEKINYKYEYKSPTTRRIERQYKETKSTLEVVADRISAEVTARESDTKELKAALTVQADRITAEVTARQNDTKTLKASLTTQADRITAEVTARQNDTKTLKASLTTQANEISAKVSRTGGNSSSFGWSLTADGWTLTSNGNTVLKANKSGLQVSGKVTATSGQIGGFTIKNGYLSTNSQTWGGTNTKGIYLGAPGIQLGKNFKVDAAGNLTAYSGTFLGSVRAGNIEFGGQDGYFDAAGLLDLSISGGKMETDAIANRHIQSGSIYPSTCNSTINGYFADVIYANKIFAGNATIDKLVTNILSAERGINLRGESLYLRDGYVRY